MKKLNVYVVGFEADPINGGVSGFNWFPKKEDAYKNFIESKDINESDGTIVYRGELEIEVSNNYSATEEQIEEVTEKVELFLEKNDWENSFA